MPGLASARRRPSGVVGPAVLTLLTALTVGGVAVPASASATMPTDATVDPALLVFDALAPGETAYDDVVLAADAPPGTTDVALVRATTDARGELVPHLATSVEACAEAWDAGTCRTGASTLLAGPADGGVATLRVPVPTSGQVHLRVGVTLDADAPQAATGTVVYRLDLTGQDAAPSPGDEGDDDDSATPGRPGAPPGLPRTGADAAALAAAALALVGLGTALRRHARARRDRRAAPGGAS